MVLVLCSLCSLRLLNPLMGCFPVVVGCSTSVEVVVRKPSTPQTGVWRQDSCSCSAILASSGSFQHSAVSRRRSFRRPEICPVLLSGQEMGLVEGGRGEGAGIAGFLGLLGILRAQGSGLRACGSGLRAQGSGLRALGLQDTGALENLLAGTG